MIEEALERYFRDVNAEDWGDFRSLWHGDAELEVVGSRYRGLDEILAYYPRALANFPVHHDDPYGIHVAGDVATVEIRFRGETKAGVETEWEALDVFRFGDGRIRKLTTWYDLEAVVALLRLPGPPERRLQRLLDRLGAGTDLAALPLTRALPGPSVPEAAIRQIVDGVPLARADLDEAARLWEGALEVAGVEPGERLQARPASPGFAEAALRRKACVVLDGGAGRALEVCERPETGVVAAGCHAGSLHVLVDGHVVEIVDGELVVTPLGRTAVPLFRYTWGEGAGWVEGACSCGSGLPRIRLLGP